MNPKSGHTRNVIKRNYALITPTAMCERIPRLDGLHAVRADFVRARRRAVAISDFARREKRWRRRN